MITEDSIFRKSLRIVQPVTGYRFAVDSILLGHFIRTGPNEKLLEIGAGTGVITILLSVLQKFQSVAAVEVQEELAELCKINFERNGILNGIVYKVDVKDLDHFFTSHSFDLIYSNPPYRKAGSGKLNRSSQKAIARHEILMNLGDLFLCAERFLKPDGRLSIVLPAFREKDFNALTTKFQMHICERQYVHSFSDQPPAFFLVTITRTTAPFHEHKPLVIYQEPGKYTNEMNLLLIDES